MERLRNCEPEPTVNDNFRAMVAVVEKIQECQMESELDKQRQRERKREARVLAMSILRAPEEQRIQLKIGFTRVFALNPDLVPDIYKTLLSARVIRAIALRELLELSLHGPIQIPHLNC